MFTDSYFNVHYDLIHYVPFFPYIFRKKRAPMIRLQLLLPQESLRTTQTRWYLWYMFKIPSTEFAQHILRNAVFGLLIFMTSKIFPTWACKFCLLPSNFSGMCCSKNILPWLLMFWFVMHDIHTSTNLNKYSKLAGCYNLRLHRKNPAMSGNCIYFWKSNIKLNNNINNI